MTLLHGMGHVARLHHEDGDSNCGNFIHEAERRSLMYRFLVERRAKAMYAAG